MSSEEDNGAQSTPSGSNLSNLFNLAFKVGDWLNSLWNFYFIIVIAVVGWILTKTPTWGYLQKGIFCSVFELAAVVNWILIFTNFRFFKLLLAGVEGEFNAGISFKSDELNVYFRTVSKRVWWIPLLLGGHGMVDLFVGYLILKSP